MSRKNLEAVWTVMEMNVEGRRGRPKKKLLDVIGCIMRTAYACIN